MTVASDSGQKCRVTGLHDIEIGLIRQEIFVLVFRLRLFSKQKLLPFLASDHEVCCLP